MTLQYNSPGIFPTVHEGQDLLPYTFLRSIPYGHAATADQRQHFELSQPVPALEKPQPYPSLCPFFEMDHFPFNQLLGQYSEPNDDKSIDAMFNEGFQYFENMTPNAQVGLFLAEDNLLSSVPNDFSLSPVFPYNNAQQWHTNTNTSTEPIDMYQNNFICSNLLTITPVDMNSPETLISEEDCQSPSSIPTPMLVKQDPVNEHETTHDIKGARKQLRSQKKKRVNIKSKPASKAGRSSAENFTRRAKEDRILIECKEKGMTFPEIMKAHDFRVAESTLRGRYRALTKDPSERPRKPEWSAHHIKLLLDAVPKFLRQSNTSKQRVAWTDVRDYIKRLGGYQFSPATCSRKYKELTGRDF